MIDKKQIITDFDRIIGNNQEVTDDTHMDLVDECADYTETLVNKLFIANVSQRSELLAFKRFISKTPQAELEFYSDEEFTDLYIKANCA